ncbi:MAG TPA: hypothetical protein VJ302_10760 [Blastocatellia bacterium]|nr:hypothetical protein [Blastocatellia bacterium]
MSTAIIAQLREQLNEVRAEADRLHQQIKQALALTGNESLTGLAREVLDLRHRCERNEPILEKVKELDRLRIEIETEALLKSTDADKLTGLRMRRTRLERELREALLSDA